MIAMRTRPDLSGCASAVYLSLRVLEKRGIALRNFGSGRIGDEDAKGLARWQAGTTYMLRQLASTSPGRRTQEVPVA